MFSGLKKFETLIPVHAPESLAELSEDLRIYSDRTIEVWYAPLGESTYKPKLWILGITPGWNQMRIAYKAAADALSCGLTPAEAVASKKPQVAFAGSMRANLITMLDELGFAEIFDVQTSANLFGTEHIRTGSVLRYPVFKNQSNYTGSAPKPTQHPVLVEMLDIILANELQSVGRCLILPLGKAVENALEYSAAKGRVDLSHVLLGFPHPSGANGHRMRQFNDR